MQYIFMVLCQAFYYLLTYAFTWYLSHNFSTNELGQYFLSFAVAQGAHVLIKSGWGQAVLKYCSPADNSVYFSNNIFINRALSSVFVKAIGLTCLFLFAYVVTRNYSTFDVSYFLFLLPMICTKGVYELLLIFFRVIGRIKIFSSCQYVINPSLRLLFVAMALFVWREFQYIPSICVSLADLCTCIGCYCIYKKIELKKTDYIYSVDENKLFEIKKYVHQIGLSLFIVYVTNSIDILLASVWLASSDIAIYQVSKQISLVIITGVIVLEPILSPSISYLIKNNKHNLLFSGCAQITTIVLMLTVGIASAFIVYPESILQIFGKEYTGGALTITIMSVSQLINLLFSFNVCILSMHGLSSVVLRNTVINTICFLICLPFLAQMLGSAGVAIACLISCLFFSVVNNYAVRRIYGNGYILMVDLTKVLSCFTFSIVVFYVCKYYALSLYALIYFLVYHIFIIMYYILFKSNSLRQLFTGMILMRESS